MNETKRPRWADQDSPISVRMEDADKALLRGLSAELGLNQSQTIRKALRLLRAVQDAR